MVLTMAEVMFEMIALRFQDIVTFVLGFPATSASGNDEGNRLFI